MRSRRHRFAMNDDRQSVGRARFWMRLAAAWVDLFVIYALTLFLTTLVGMAGVRIALEPMFILVGAAYGALLLAWQDQTVGKMLARITVSATSGGTLRLRHVLLREVVGKWGLGIAAPLAVGRVLLGGAWVPTIYDALILAAVLLLQLIYYLIAKRAWYDQIAGTVVNRTVSARRRPMVAFIALMGAAALGAGAVAVEFGVRGRLPCRLMVFQSMRQTAPYVRFLERGQPTPVDYIIGLFDRYDVVVICERLHPEGSQWEFIFEVVRDPRFADRVGHVFTEYGQVGMQDDLDSFMAADGLTPGEVHDRVVHLMRHPPVWPVWVNTNFYTYLTRLYALNQTLPPDRRIHLHFTDGSVDWEDLTRETYQAHRRSLGDRDRQMAQRIITEMERMAAPAPRPPRCLVVMNYRHAFDLTGGRPDAERFNTFEYLKNAFGDRAANVLLITERPVTAFSSETVLLNAPIAGGVWDAAFERTGNRLAGFDFEGSPFGQDPFDLFPFRPELKERLAYRDVFTGFVFDHPLDEQYTQLGIPGYFAGFEQEALRRAGFIGEGYRKTIESLIDQERRGEAGIRQRVVAPVSKLDLALIVLVSPGWLIGVGLIALRRRARSNGGS
jgi:uncharacterized RDD family membrane protein YckC